LDEGYLVIWRTSAYNQLPVLDCLGAIASLRFPCLPEKTGPDVAALLLFALGKPVAEWLRARNGGHDWYDVNR
jgi:hypothetical protein